MKDIIEGPSEELETLLEAERGRPDPAADWEATVLRRLEATIGQSAPGNVPGDAGPTTGLSGVRPAPSVGVSAAALSSRAVLRTAATLLIGAVGGAGIHALWDRRAAEKLPAAAAPAYPETFSPMRDGVDSADAGFRPPGANQQDRPDAPAAGLPPPTKVRSEASRVAASPDHRREVGEPDRNLTAERQLVEQAHTALSRGQSEAALRVLERHARMFPQGELLEERESLMVQGLVELGRFDHARERGAAFHRRFPRSIFGAVVDESLRSIP